MGGAGGRSATMAGIVRRAKRLVLYSGEARAGWTPVLCLSSVGARPGGAEHLRRCIGLRNDCSFPVSVVHSVHPVGS